MGRPPVVSDEEIIAAGRKLQAAGTVNATRIWVACGKRGRLERLFDVWTRWLDAQAGEGVAALPGLVPPIPEEALRLAAGLKAELLTGIDQALASIYQGIEEAVKGRYQAELSDLAAVREAHAQEMQDAVAALGDLSEAQYEREARIADLEAALASTLRQRDVSEALRGAGAEQHSVMADRLRAAEAQLERERAISVDLKIANVRADGELKALTRQLSDMQTRLEAPPPGRPHTARGDTLAAASSVAPPARRARGKGRLDAAARLDVHPDGPAPGPELGGVTNGFDGHAIPAASP